MESIEIASSDVIKLILQYLKENNLKSAVKALEAETNIVLNTLDVPQEVFLSYIRAGKWDMVLSEVNNLSLPIDKSIKLYEQIVMELVMLGEKELAKDLVTNVECLQLLKSSDIERYMLLEHHCNRKSLNEIEINDINNTKDSKRNEIALSIASELISVPKSRLLGLLNQALTYQKLTGALPKDGKYDLFQGDRRVDKKESEEKLISRQANLIKFNPESHPETALFAPDGASLVTGFIDGFIEVWDYETCKLRTDLDYQAKDEFMMHENQAVTSSIFSKDGEYLATGSQGGQLKVWRLSDGQCVRKYLTAHSKGITSICFSKDNTQLLTTSFDTMARIHGLKSGKTIKEFRGHTSFVNCGLFTSDNNVLTASSDGTMKLWNYHTSECIHTCRPGYEVGRVLKELTIHTMQIVPTAPEHVFVCTKSSQAFILTIQGGHCIQSFSSGNTDGVGDFVCATISPQAKFFYCVGEDNNMYLFDIQSGKLENFIPTNQTEIIGICHHPSRNLVATYSADGIIKLWRP